jgi:hypothetical protein
VDSGWYSACSLVEFFVIMVRGRGPELRGLSAGNLVFPSILKFVVSGWYMALILVDIRF